MKNIKNRLIYFFCAILRIFFKKTLFDEQNPKILIISTTALGDSLWATPSLKAIKKRYKNAYLGVLCSNIAYEIFKTRSDIDKFFILKKRNLFSFFPLFLQLKKEHFQAIIILHSSQRLILPMSYLLNSQYLISTKGINKDLDRLLTHSIENSYIHEIKRRFELLKILDIYPKDTSLEFILKASSSLSNTSKRIILHPGAKDRYKCWSEENFISLGNKLSNLGYEILITGIEEERELIEKIEKNIFRSKAYIGLKLHDVASLIKSSKLLISSDTGVFHLSIALRVKTLGLYAPTDPSICGPLNTKDAIIIKKEPICTPCLRRKCISPICLENIKVEEVFEKCINILK